MASLTLQYRVVPPLQTESLSCLREGKDSYRASLQSHEAAFLSLVERVGACRTCPRMEGRTRVLGNANGNLQAKALFVAEAPGRLGADACNIPLHGDQTGRNFEQLLEKAGLRREAVFITNAVLCNPREQGRNSSPTAREICNCADHLRETIEIVQPRFVIALGNVALQALKAIAPHSARLSEDVGRCIAWQGRCLVPLYHPGPRARLHRSLELQIEDFRKLASLISTEEK